MTFFENIGTVLSDIPSLWLGILASIVVIALVVFLVLSIVYIVLNSKNAEKRKSLERDNSVLKYNESSLREENNKLHSELDEKANSISKLRIKLDETESLLNEANNRPKDSEETLQLVAKLKDNTKVLKKKNKELSTSLKALNDKYNQVTVNEYNNWTADALINELKANDVKIGIAKMKKAELVQLLVDVKTETDKK